MADKEVRLIDVNELIEDINEEIAYGEECINHDNELINKGLRIARKLAKAAPTIEAQPVKHGRWIDTHECYEGGYDSWDIFKCSLCGKESVESGDFCPNCGARMDGDSE